MTGEGTVGMVGGGAWDDGGRAVGMTGEGWLRCVWDDGILEALDLGYEPDCNARSIAGRY